jgi:hypothetical protein
MLLSFSWICYSWNDSDFWNANENMFITQNSELNSSSTSLIVPARLLHQSKIHIIRMSPLPAQAAPPLPHHFFRERSRNYPLDESKDMEVGLKQFVYCPSFSPICLCSFVVLYGGGVAAGSCR